MSALSTQALALLPQLTCDCHGGPELCAENCDPDTCGCVLPVIRSALEAAQQVAVAWKVIHKQLARMLNAGAQVRSASISLWVGVDSSHPVKVFDSSDPTPCSTFAEALTKAASWCSEQIAKYPAREDNSQKDNAQ